MRYLNYKSISDYFQHAIDLPTSRASKAELEARKMYMIRERKPRGHLQLRRPRTTLGKSEHAIETALFNGYLNLVFQQIRLNVSSHG